MADLPRYSIDAQRNYYRDPLLMIDPAPDGDWVKWGDVSARLQQLEQEKDEWRRSVGLAEARLVADHAEANVVIERLMAEKADLSAALAETRDALQKLQEQYDDVSRSGAREISDHLQSSAAADKGPSE